MRTLKLARLYLTLNIVGVCAVMLCGMPPVMASMTPAELQCEFRSNPLGLDVVQPRLRWQVQSGERAQTQIAYRILVASSEALLRAGTGDLWDSERVASSETANINYGGRPLKSGAECFWNVKIWDQAGKESDWSAPAKWSMGLLEPGDWRGKWIGWDQGGKSNDFGGAQWIWFPEGNPAASASVCTRYFRKDFEIPTNEQAGAAVITITADDQFDLFINGQRAGEGRGWGDPKAISVSGLLKPGKNMVAVEVRNIGNQPNPAGLVAKLRIEFEQGKRMTVTTGADWKCATNLEAGWTALNFDDKAWTEAKRLGEYGTQTWGVIQSDDRPLPARYLRREFSVDKEVRRATAYVCGLGLSELYLNGKKASADVLSPAIASYDHRAFYVTYDVSENLRQGDNAIGVLLGNGRYYAPRVRVPAECRTFGYPKLILQLNVEYADGTTSQIVSDEQWKVTDAGPIRANNEFDGEVYDARMELAGWDKPKYNDTKWQGVELVKPGAPVLTAQIGEPIRVLEAIKPIAVTNPKPGVYIFDMGQNMAGWCRLQVRGLAGTTVKLRHGEDINPDGSLYVANMRSAKAEDSYTLKGSGVETYEPRFTHHGFRFVEVTGFPGKPELGAIEGKVVHDALPKAGEFVTSNPLINQLYHNIYWGTRDNYRSLPTDMPRDERQGWLGDRQEVSKGETYLFNIGPIYAQWLTHIQDAQRADGSVPDVCPAFWPLYQDGVVWASTYVIVPAMMYDQYGDVGVLRKHYDSQKRWVDYMSRFLENDLMTRNTYGDWCFPPRLESEMTVINSTDPKLTTDGNMMSSAIFHHDLKLLARSARLLGKPAEAERFELLAARMKAAFNKRYYNADLGYYDNGTQTSCILPLAFGIVTEENKAKVFAQLVKSITVENDNHLRTGLIGGHYLMRVLSDNGRPDLAYTIATQTTYPSWGYMISKGATTMWELWNGDRADAGMNARNIVMMIGDLNIWLHEYLGGIRPAAPGFKKIIIKPEPVGDLTMARVKYDSIHGRISSEWRKSNGKFELQVTIPANTTATVYLPAKSVEAVTESGKALNKTGGVKSVRMEGDRAVIETGSGSFQFVSNGG